MLMTSAALCGPGRGGILCQTPAVSDAGGVCGSWEPLGLQGNGKGEPSQYEPLTLRQTLD